MYFFSLLSGSLYKQISCLYNLYENFFDWGVIISQWEMINLH